MNICFWPSEFSSVGSLTSPLPPGKYKNDWQGEASGTLGFSQSKHRSALVFYKSEAAALAGERKVQSRVGTEWVSGEHFLLEMQASELMCQAQGG